MLSDSQVKDVIQGILDVVGKVCDQQSDSIGIVALSMDLHNVKTGEKFAIYCKGGNVDVTKRIPFESAIYCGCTVEKQGYTLKTRKDECPTHKEN